MPTTAKEGQSKTIGGHDFTVYLLPWEQANDVLIEIADVIAPALAQLAAEPDSLDTLLESKLDGPEVAKVIAAAVQKLTRERMRFVTQTLMSVTHCDGKELKAISNAVFRGELTLMYKWLAFAIQVNYADFLSALQSTAAGVGKATDPRAG